MNQTMKDCKVVVLPLDTDVNLVDMLVEGINASAGNIAMRCSGSPKSVLQKANRDGVAAVVFYGMKEIMSGNAGVRDMATRTQYEVPIQDLIGYLASKYLD